MKPGLLAAVLFLLASAPALADGVAVIGSPDLPKLDNATIQKLFTGRIVELNGTRVTVVNAAPGHAVRTRFLAAFLNQGDEKYIAYWTVRKFIGKGQPPAELDSAAAVIRFVQSTPGAIGYIDAADLTPGLNVLNRK
ncbi:hypothetical protein B9N43_15310 [Denitratisoma sp. DHT3]|uniref:substrate-binding domain-containing protein n=1 Tax=Denitratisoma sp. DHT3 TaxID=1981880 RepID=UPI0011989530|nr:substrate-binding domain-containing protein [Denitratisoma sp. DHT3]QDX82481.1 hypothetical protein B9N43_15310 [Denitratisoma sp. DHT3]